MKNLIISAMMLTGVVTFAQESSKKPDVKEATQTTTTTNAEKPVNTHTDTPVEVSKTTEVKQDANGDRQVMTSGTVKVATPAQPMTQTPPVTPTQPATSAKTNTTTIKKQH